MKFFPSSGNQFTLISPEGFRPLSSGETLRLFFQLSFTSAKTGAKDGIVSVKLNGVEQCQTGQIQTSERSSSMESTTRKPVTRKPATQTTSVMESTSPSPSTLMSSLLTTLSPFETTTFHRTTYRTTTLVPTSPSLISNLTTMTYEGLFG